MIFAPKPIGAGRLEPAALKADRKACERIGPCGLGDRALYLGGLLFERSWYVPLADLERAYKRVIVGSGGFNAVGPFASPVQVVARCRDGAEWRCGFRRPQEADRLLEALGRACPGLPLASAEAERRLKEAEAAEAARYAKKITAEAEAARRELERARRRLESDVPALCRRLSETAKRRRALDLAGPFARAFPFVVLAVSLALVAAGLAALARGHASWPYFLLFGAAFGFMVFATGALPVGRNARPAIHAAWEEAEAAMAGYLGDDPFPLPPRYAHPVVLTRMIRAIRQGRAADAAEALAVVKEDLKNLHRGVEVPPKEYDEVVVVKAMFLINDYR